MQKIYINYANADFSVQQVKNTTYAYEIGKVDMVIPYTPDDIDRDFYQKNKKILHKTRGAGYWLWKFYIIQKTLLRDDIKNGDVIVYADSGTKILQDLSPVFAMPDSYDQDVILFDIGEQCNRRIKRDAFILMGCDTPSAYQAPMASGTVSIWRKSAYAMRFIDTCLRYATVYDIIGDGKSKLGDERPTFEMHRHDQAIFSLVAFMEHLSLIHLEDMGIYGWGGNTNVFFQPERAHNRNAWQRMQYRMAMIPEKIQRYGGFWGYVIHKFHKK